MVLQSTPGRVKRIVKFPFEPNTVDATIIV